MRVRNAEAHGEDPGVSAAPLAAVRPAVRSGAATSLQPGERRPQGTASSAFLSALRGERPRHRPIWLMRQAGRYLPEYQALRARHSFLELCHVPELACEATLQPIRRFGFDAAILFNDILVPLTSMGVDFHFTENGPRLASPLRDEVDIARLRTVPAAEGLPFVAEAVGLLKRELGATPLIGFAGAPFTLAAYLVEGGASRHHHHLKTMLYRRPDLLVRLLDLLADQVADHLRLQIAAGADAIQLFDSWAGILAPADYDRFVLPGLQRIFGALSDTGVPRILFVKNTASYLESAARAGADALSLDWTIDLAAALPRLGDLCVQGNLDPLALQAEPTEIRRRARAICRAGDHAGGHVFNLGHGVLPDTPLAAVEALVAAVQEYRGTGETDHEQENG
jgi:uroporphyrinogen decarboxylase